MKSFRQKTEEVGSGIKLSCYKYIKKKVIYSFYNPEFRARPLPPRGSQHGGALSSAQVDVAPRGLYGDAPSVTEEQQQQQQ